KGLLGPMLDPLISAISWDPRAGYTAKAGTHGQQAQVKPAEESHGLGALPLARRDASGQPTAPTHSSIDLPTTMGAPKLTLSAPPTTQDVAKAEQLAKELERRSAESVTRTPTVGELVQEALRSGQFPSPSTSDSEVLPRES